MVPVKKTSTGWPVLLGAVLLLSFLGACSTGTREVVVEVTVVVTPTPGPAVTATSVGSVLVISADEQRERWSARLPADYASATPPFPLDDEATAAAGERLFMENNCWLCHGQRGDGAGPLSPGLSPRPVDFTDAALMARLTDAYLFWRLSEGGAQPPFLSSMPAWKAMLSPQERWQLVAYVRSIATAGAAAGVSEQVGLELLQKYGCLGCHRYAGKGNFAGPDLDNVGARRDADFIRQSILDPSAEVAKGYRDIMPKDYGQRISPEDLDALVEFLARSSGG